MMPWLESLGVLLLAAFGVAGGLWFSRRPSPYWLAGYLVPLLLIIGIGASRHYPYLELRPPFLWIMHGRIEFALTPLLGCMILSTLLSRIPKQRDKVAVSIMMFLATISVALPVFLGPALSRSYHQSLPNQYHNDGVCKQSSDYSCGPAAAVTALRRFGISAEEGKIAIMAHTSRFMGTETDILADALQRHFGSQGITAEYRHFKSIDDLSEPEVTIARVKYGFLLDHYVTVLEVREHDLLIADPLTGLKEISHEGFRKQWRFTGVALSRKTPGERIEVP